MSPCRDYGSRLHSIPVIAWPSPATRSLASVLSCLANSPAGLSATPRRCILNRCVVVVGGAAKEFALRLAIAAFPGVSHLCDQTKTAAVGHDPALRAAYLLGRHPAVLEIWLEFLRGIASDPIIPWESPFDEWWPAPDETPWELEDFNDALCELAALPGVDIAALVELHRSWDRLTDRCSEMAEMVEVDNREEVENLYWAAVKDSMATQRWAQRLIPPGSELSAWLRFGASLGQLILRGLQDRPEVDVPSIEIPGMLGAASSADTELRATTELQRKVRLLDEAQQELSRLTAGNVDCYSPVQQALSAAFLAAGGSLANIAQLRSDLTDAAVGLDNQLREAFSASVPVQPLLEINDPGNAMVFLGERFTYSQFPSDTKGGLECFLVMARKPGQKFTYEELKQATNRECEEQQLHAYMSRFRSVVKSAINRYLANHSGELARDAGRAFIRAWRGRGRGPQRGYMCTLNPRLIRYL